MLTYSTNLTCDAAQHDELLINRNSAVGALASARLHGDAATAARVSRLAAAVLGRRTERKLRFDQRGTWLRLAPEPPSLPGFGGVAPLVELIGPLNEWLAARAAAIRVAEDPTQLLDASDNELSGLGPTLRDTLIGLSGSVEFQIPMETRSGSGGILSIPPRSLLVAPARGDVCAPTYAIVKCARLEVLIRTHVGIDHFVDSSTVDRQVRASEPVRLLRPKVTNRRWRWIGGIKRTSGMGKVPRG